MQAERTVPENIRERLLERQQELSVRRQRLAADRRREAEPLSADAADRAIQQSNDEVVDSIDSAVESELRALADALTRLEAGKYGVCESCGGSIDAKRLAAVPYAVECRSCAAQAGS